MKVWTPEEEADRLTARFSGINRAEFARQHKVPGGAAMVYQHMRGLRPIGFEAATAYARGFQVPLRDISPRLATQAMVALGVEVSAHPPKQDKFALLHSLPPACQDALLTLARAMVR